MVDRADPGAGDPWALRVAGWERHEKAEAITSMATTVTAAAASASGAAWTGAAQVRFQQEVEQVTPDLAALASSLRATGDALLTYAGAIAGIKEQQEILARRRARLEEEQETLQALWRAADEESQTPYITLDEPAARADELKSELREVGSELDALEEDWDALVRRRELADSDIIGALVSREVRGALYVFANGDTASMNASEMLHLLSTMSVADMRALAVSSPEMLDRMRQARPEEVSAWWAGLGGGNNGRGSAQQNALIENLPAFVGALGGLPALVRVAANRIVATRQLRALRQELSEVKDRGHRDYDPNQPYAYESAVADYLTTTRSLQLEIDYLERVASGEVQLYLYQREQGRIIEMFGDPDNADVMMTFMPGTNTTMENFYESGRNTGITALTGWQVREALESTNVAGFVVKQGEFPNLGDVWSEGPQHNWYADVLGSRYASLTHELDVVTGGTPHVSVEHSFGSAVGGKAEAAGAQFEARYMLSGIGMTDGYEPYDTGTSYYAAQGPADVNRHLDDVQIGGLGYAITPGEVPGVVEIDTGYTDGAWTPYAAPFAPGIAIPVMGYTALDQHNRIISGDEQLNGPVLRDIRRVLQEASLQ